MLDFSTRVFLGLSVVETFAGIAKYLEFDERGQEKLSVIGFGALELVVGLLLNYSVLEDAEALQNGFSRLLYRLSVSVDCTGIIADILGELAVFSHTENDQHRTGSNAFSKGLLVAFLCFLPNLLIMLVSWNRIGWTINIEVIDLIEGSKGTTPIIICFFALCFMQVMVIVYCFIMKAMASLGHEKSHAYSKCYLICVALSGSILMVPGLLCTVDKVGGYIYISLTALPAILATSFFVSKLHIENHMKSMASLSSNGEVVKLFT